MDVSIEQARVAKSRARTLIAPLAPVVGLGLTRIGNSYAVNVNLGEPAPAKDLLTSLDGVSLVYEVVGPIRARRVPSA